MTLIISVVTESYAVQASDRRLTLPDGALFEDAENKAIIVDNSFAAAYTGLAACEGSTTASWLVGKLEAEGIDGLLAWARGVAGGSPFCQAQRPPGVPARTWREARRTAFVLAGFINWLDGDATVHEMAPTIAVISNGLREDQTWARAANDYFRSSGSLLTTQPFLLRTHGQAVRGDDLNDLRRAIGECVQRRTSPWPVARLVTRAIKRTADQNSAVGPNVMCVVLPRTTDRSRFRGRGFALTLPIDEAKLFRHDPASAGVASYVYLPADVKFVAHQSPVVILDNAIIGPISHVWR